VRLTIRSKLVLFTVLPVIAVFSILFWLGVSHVRDHLSSNAQRWLVAHAQHQASRLALVLSQVPLLAQSLGDLVLAEPGQSQTLLYAHLIDGLRRTPIARTAAIARGDPERGALMHRGELAGEALPVTYEPTPVRRAGWQTDGERLRFNRAIYRQGQRVGDTWVELETMDVYSEIERLRRSSVTLFVSHDDGSVLVPAGMPPEFNRLAAMIPLDTPADEVQTIGEGTQTDTAYWLVSTNIPGSPWHITAVTLTRTALQPAQREASIVAVTLLLSLVVVVVIIGTVARQITRPLAELNTSVRQIAQGDFTVAPEVTSGDELGALATAIRRMGAHIADREAQLHSAYQVLEQRVAERTSALQESNVRLVRQIEETRSTEEALRLANEQAQQANRAKSEFLSNMSHELRTPLHGVLGYAQILQRDAATSPGQRENLEAIERCGQHLLTLINDILDLTKIEAGQMQLDVQATDLQQLLEDVRMIVAQRADSKGLLLRMSLAADLPCAIYTDAVKLKQILLNLLGNAVKFTEQGTVTLQAQLDPDKQLHFEVSDTGIGIPADKISSIFDPFHQAREGQAIDGTGLGLAINQRLISLLGGKSFRVESEPGVGSRFGFRIPCRPATQGRQADPGGLTAGGRQRLVAGMSCRVMVVDRLTENRGVLESLLRLANCEVESLADEAEAIRRLGERAFDLILIDLRQIGRGTTETVSTLRHAIAFGSAKLVAVSANVLEDSEQLARQAGFDAFLAKPFSDQQLFGLIERLLDIHFETCPAQQQIPLELQPEWPKELAVHTAEKIRAAIELGDIASLFQLAEELAENPDAPPADAENLALMARMFDFDGLRRLSERMLDTV